MFYFNHGYVETILISITRDNTGKAIRMYLKGLSKATSTIFENQYIYIYYKSWFLPYLLEKTCEMLTLAIVMPDCIANTEH